MKFLTLEGVMSVQAPNDAMASFFLLWRGTLKWISGKTERGYKSCHLRFRTRGRTAFFLKLMWLLLVIFIPFLNSQFRIE